MKDFDHVRILVSRPDRIGDVVLSTPVFEALKRQYPHSKLTVLVKEAIVPLLEGLPWVDEVFIYEPEGRHAGLRGLYRLCKEVRAQNLKIAIALQSERRIALAFFLARVRYRVGPLSKLHSFLLYNRGVRQRRSQVEMHEADYNLQLLRRIGVRTKSRKILTQVNITPESQNRAKEWLVANGWLDEGAPEKKVIVHSGMSGSALNWPEDHYLELIRKLLNQGHGVIATFGPTEGHLRSRMEAALADYSGPGKLGFYGGPDSGPLDQLVGLLNQADVIVAPSTGPLHLGVALEKRVVTFYAPIRVQSAIRWGPYIADESRASVLVPEVYCGQDFSCLGSHCNYYPCMKRISVTQALEEVGRHLAEESKRDEKH